MFENLTSRLPDQMETMVYRTSNNVFKERICQEVVNLVGLMDLKSNGLVVMK